MFTTLIVQPIFNLLVFIYAILPGHNFGLALIVFTVLTRLLMWPLVKKQLHHAKKMRELQPELKRIKKQTKGNRQQESIMVMELYKERGINPFAPIGLLIVQLPIFIALYSGIRRIVDNPQTLIDFSYPFIQNLSWMKQLATDLGQFDETLFGIVDLARPALNNGSFYLPAFLIVAASAVVQFYQSKMMMPTDKDSKGLRQILNEAKTGKQAEQSEVSAAVGRSTMYFLPLMVFAFTIGLPSALPLYWLVSGLTALVQQKRVLGQDQEELVELAEDKKTKQPIEGEVLPSKKSKKTKNKKSKNSRSSKTKRRKK